MVNPVFRQMSPIDDGQAVRIILDLNLVYANAIHGTDFTTKHEFFKAGTIEP